MLPTMKITRREAQSRIAPFWVNRLGQFAAVALVVLMGV
jgi:hypothetical protein